MPTNNFFAGFDDNISKTKLYLALLLCSTTWYARRVANEDPKTKDKMRVVEHYAKIILINTGNKNPSAKQININAQRLQTNDQNGDCKIDKYLTKLFENCENKTNHMIIFFNYLLEPDDQVLLYLKTTLGEDITNKMLKHAVKHFEIKMQYGFKFSPSIHAYLANVAAPSDPVLNSTQLNLYRPETLTPLYSKGLIQIIQSPVQSSDDEDSENEFTLVRAPTRAKTPSPRLESSNV